LPDKFWHDVEFVLKRIQMLGSYSLRYLPFYPEKNSFYISVIHKSQTEGKLEFPMDNREALLPVNTILVDCPLRELMNL